MKLGLLRKTKTLICSTSKKKSSPFRQFKHFRVLPTKLLMGLPLFFLHEPYQLRPGTRPTFSSIAKEKNSL